MTRGLTSCGCVTGAMCPALGMRCSACSPNACASNSVTCRAGRPARGARHQADRAADGAVVREAVRAPQDCPQLDGKLGDDAGHFSAALLVECRPRPGAALVVDEVAGRVGRGVRVDTLGQHLHHLADFGPDVR